MDKFDDVIAGNRAYVDHYHETGMSGRAAKGLALITCMDSRIDPLAALGMQAGDMKILRNAGARVTDDVLRTLVLATHLLDVDRIIVMPHTDCRMAITGAIRKFFAEKPAEFDPRSFMKPAMAAMQKVCKQRYEEFGAAGHGSKIKAIPLAEMAKRYASGELDPKIA